MSRSRCANRNNATLNNIKLQVAEIWYISEKSVAGTSAVYLRCSSYTFLTFGSSFILSIHVLLPIHPIPFAFSGLIPRIPQTVCRLLLSSSVFYFLVFLFHFSSLVPCG